MKRVLLIGNYLPDQQHSMLRYADWIKRSLEPHGWQVDLIQPPVRFGYLTRSLNKWLAYVDKFLLFPLTLFLQARRYDLVHICDQSNAPYRLILGRKSVIVTCHDLIAIKTMLGEFKGRHLRFSGRLLQRIILASLKTVPFIFCCVSEHTREDVVRLTGINKDQTAVIPNPVLGYAPFEKAQSARILRDAGIDVDGPFLLHVGGNIWYKNRIGVVTLFGNLLERARLKSAHLVCAGEALSGEQRDTIAEFGMADRVHELVSPTSVILRALYNSADALLFISLEEGFGWPIVEAQACGCPVITSDREPMRSIAGPAGFFVDPENLNEASSLIDGHWDWITGQRSASIENAERFSEARAAERYAALYREVLKGGRSTHVNGL